MPHDRRRVLGFLGAGAASVALPAARAQGYPDRALKLVVGYATGGATDAAARAVGRRLEQRLGQPVVFEYKPGAGASIGAEYVARAVPDGYTIGLTDTGPLTIMPNLRKVSYDPVKDFTALSAVCVTGLALMVNPALPVASTDELIKLLRSEPDKYSYASSGVGSVHHLAGELFKSKASVQMRHIAYRGAAPALNDLIAGQIPIMFATIGPALPMIQAGKARVLGVTAAKRSAALPQVLTLAEQGLQDYEATLRFSMVAPVGLPAAVAARLQAELRQVMLDPGLIAELHKTGNDDVGPRTPAEVLEMTRADLKKWGTIIRDAKISLDS